MIKAILFDLDGTLLPMDQDYFISEYMKGLAAKMTGFGYEPEPFIKAMWAGVKAIYKNDGSLVNEDCFWNVVNEVLNRNVRADELHFNSFYENEFQNYKSVCGFDERAATAVRAIKEKGFRVALATNPFFPAIATASRIRWAGLDPSEFEFYTTFENSYSCKPDPRYYLEVAKKMDLDPDECLMVGNDVRDDMTAATVGMKVFLLTDCLINVKQLDTSAYPQGSFEELMRYIETL